MVNESSDNNTRDEEDEIFTKIEEKVSNISCNMALLMTTLANKFGPFGEVGDSNS
jgi:hypothetical protein